MSDDEDRPTHYAHIAHVHPSMIGLASPLIGAAALLGLMASGTAFDRPLTAEENEEIRRRREAAEVERQARLEAARAARLEQLRLQAERDRPTVERAAAKRARKNAKRLKNARR